MAKQENKEEKTVEKKEEVKKVVKKVAKVAAESKNNRKVVSVKPSRNSAVVSAGGKEYKVVHHLKRKTKEALVAGPSGKSVPVKDWLAGKADLGLS